MSETMPAVIEVSGASVLRGGQRVLDEVDLRVEAG